MYPTIVMILLSPQVVNKYPGSGLRTSSISDIVFAEECALSSAEPGKDSESLASARLGDIELDLDTRPVARPEDPDQNLRQRGRAAASSSERDP